MIALWLVACSGEINLNAATNYETIRELGVPPWRVGCEGQSGDIFGELVGVGDAWAEYRPVPPGAYRWVCDREELELGQTSCVITNSGVPSERELWCWAEADRP